MIDISDPGWIRKLDALVESRGGKKFDHVFVFDHGNVGRVAFGKHPEAYAPYPEFLTLHKEAAATNVIASVLADKGTLHLGSCLTGQGEAGLQYLKDLHKAMGRGDNISIDAITGVMYNRANQFTGDLITYPPRQPQPQPPHEKR